MPITNRAQAAPAIVTFTVNSTLDQPDDLTIPGTCHTAANTCTLRAAVMQANRTTGLGANILIPAGIYTLTIPFSGLDGEENGDLNLTTPGSGSPSITITGAGAGVTIIDGNHLDRVFNVRPGRVAAISDVTIRNGFVAMSAPNIEGGGIYNAGSLTVSRAVISANHAAYGGGISNDGALSSLYLVNSTLSQNFAGIDGGAIENVSSLELRDTTLSQNTAIESGGAIASIGGTVKVRNSTIFGNGSNDGGGIHASGATLYVINSTISQNFANTNGGGIAIVKTFGLAGLYSTSIIDNDADHDRDQLGGIGGGVYSEAGARVIVVNTMIARNTILNAPIDDDCNGTLEVYGWNLIGEIVGCTFTGNGYLGSVFYVLPNTIGPLQNNGGPTWTHALLAGNLGIDTTIFGNLGCVDETGALLTTDQRGAPRPVGLHCDVGAFEYSPLHYLYLPLLTR